MKILKGLLISLNFMVILLNITVCVPARNVDENAVKILAAQPVTNKSDIKVIEGFNAVINGRNIHIKIYYTFDKYQMVQLRPISEALGYDVVWDAKNKTAILSKDNMTFKIVSDSKLFNAGYLIQEEGTNIEAFETEDIELMEPATILKGTMYISTDFFDMLNAEIIANDEIVVINDYDYIPIKHSMVAFNEIYLGMTVDEAKNVLGDPLSIDNDISIFVGAKTLEVSRYAYDNLLLDFDSNLGLVGIDLKDDKLSVINTNVKIGSDISEIFKLYGKRDPQSLNGQVKLFYNYVTDNTLDGIRHSVVFVAENNIIMQIYMSILMDASIGLESSDFVFNELHLGSTKKELLKAMGTPISEEESTSSAVSYEIETSLLNYDGIFFHVNDSLGIVEIFYNIDYFPTVRGIRIGDSVSNLFEKYGMVEISDMEYNAEGVRVFYDYRMSNKLKDLNYGITFTVVNEIITGINAYTIM